MRTFDLRRLPRPRLRDSGDVVITGRNWDDEGHFWRSVTIDRADPRVLISAELLEQARAGKLRYCSVDGDVLTITADNGRWIYVLGEYEPRCDAWWMEWPD